MESKSSRKEDKSEENQAIKEETIKEVEELGSDEKSKLKKYLLNRRSK